MTTTIERLLQRSREQAEAAAPLVRATAKMRIARVEAASDHARGRITLEMALEEVAALPEPERTLLFEHARIFAAAVEPFADHEQLAVGARRYPNGWDSIRAEAEDRRRELQRSAEPRSRGHLAAGASRDIAFQFALQDGDFDRAMDISLERYGEDIDQEALNFAPKVLWPSAAHFRNVLYQAGKDLGTLGERLLYLVPDTDLQLLAKHMYVGCLYLFLLSEAEVVE